MAAKKTSAGRRGAAKGAAKGKANADAQADADARAQEDAAAPDQKAASTSDDTPAAPWGDKAAPDAEDAAAAQETDNNAAASDMDKKPDADADTDTDTETSGSDAAPALTAPEQRGGGLSMVLGGIVAAGIGFGAAYWVFPQMGLLVPPQDMTDITSRINDAQDRLDALAAEVDALPPAPDLAPLEGEVAQLSTTLSEQMAADMERLTSRIDALEARPVAEGSAISVGEITALQEALAVQQEALNAQAGELDDLTARITSDEAAARAAADEAASAKLRRAALARLGSALDTGAPFDAALADLDAAGITPPDALRAAAETGVPTRAALENAFPPAAREALASARASGEAGEEGGNSVLNFLSDQLGARSLEAREGPGTDAILSRAEAALREGRLADALNEVDTLPETARAPLAGWAETARSRLEATAALDALAADLN